jgi:hypothetical protein
LAPSTSVDVLTYPNVFPISTSAPKNVKCLFPSFVTLATGATPKDPYQTFLTPRSSTPMTKITGATIVTSSTVTQFSVIPEFSFKNFKPQQTNTEPVVENVGSDRGTDFQDPKTCLQQQFKKRGNGQLQQQQPAPQTQFSDYQKTFEFMEKQIAGQKCVLDEALK